MDDAVYRRWFTRDPRRNKFRKYGGTLLFLSVFALIWLFEQGLAWFWVPFALTVLVLLMLPGRWLAARAAVGSAMLAQVLDFRRYIETAEAEQLAAEERQAIFNRYLPYAQAFGLAQHWTRKFAAVGAAVPSGWYEGSSDLPEAVRFWWSARALFALAGEEQGEASCLQHLAAAALTDPTTAGQIRDGRPTPLTAHDAAAVALPLLERAKRLRAGQPDTTLVDHYLHIARTRLE